MQFKDVAGQETAKKGLLQLWQSERLPHALLFAGKEGFGGLPLALAFVQYVFCENKQAEDSCGICTNCNRVTKLIQPDLHFTFPSVSPKPGTKASSNYYLNDFRSFVAQNAYGTVFDWLQFINAENKQGNITAEECREIIDNFNLTAFEGGYKVHLIWMPEYLGKSGNILLKLIEEPPPQSLIILVAEEEQNVLNTILSRTQLIKLMPISAQAIAEALVSQHKIEHRKALQIAQLAEGSLTNAIQLLQHTDEDLLPPLKNWFNGVFTNNGVAIVQWVDAMDKMGREQQKNFLQFTQQLLSHAFRLSFMPDYVVPLADDEAVFAGKLAQRKFSAEAYRQLDDALSTAIYHISRNAHSKTQLLHLSLTLQHIISMPVL